MNKFPLMPLPKPKHIKSQIHTINLERKYQLQVSTQYLQTRINLIGLTGVERLRKQASL